MPYQDTSDYERIKRRREISRAMQERAMAPYETQMVSGRAVPFSFGKGLTDLASAYFGREGEEKADIEEAELKKTYGEGKMQAIQDALLRAKGTPVGQAGPQIPTPDSMGAVGDIMGSQYAGDLKPVSDALLKRELGKGITPYYRFLPTAEGYKIGDTRTGQILTPEQLAVRSQDDPALQRKLAEQKQLGLGGAELVTDPATKAAVTIAEKEAERGVGMEGAASLVSQAEEILKGTREGSALPTGSGIGSIYDKVAGFFGANPEGSLEAQELRVIGGAMTAKVPRFEGPQSDKDLKAYRQMAGEISDDSITVEKRLAALKKFQSTWAKYELQKDGTYLDTKTSSTSGVIEVDW